MPRTSCSTTLRRPASTTTMCPTRWSARACRSSATPSRSCWKESAPSAASSCARDRRSPSARSRGGNHVSPTSPLLQGSPQRPRRGDRRRERRGERAGKPPGFPLRPFHRSSAKGQPMSVATQQKLVERIWARDPTVWTGADEDRWLGWLDEPIRMQERAGEIAEFAAAARTKFETFVLLGMGGSSLAPEVLKRTFGAKQLHVLDTTHPAMIRHAERSLDLSKTMFIVSSKSGGTLETLSHFEYFWEKAGKSGEQFVAITDPGSALEQLATERGISVFAGEPTIGGRYSALSPFGIVPAALMGIDIERVLASGERMAEACRGDANPGLQLGLQLGERWREGRDKVCIGDTDGNFGLWAEQLIAESTGKQGRGLVPAPGERPDGPDRQAAEVRLADPDEIGAEFFRWEFA